MVGIKKDPSLQMHIHQYLVTGRRIPKILEKEEVKRIGKKYEEKIFSMRVFAKNAIQAKSKFWKQMKLQNKLKPSQGEILQVNELFEKQHHVVRTYGMVIKYHSRSGIHNFYKEFRDVSVCGAVSQMYMHMAGNHRAMEDTIQIVRTAVLNKTKDIKRPTSTEYMSSKLRFPIVKTLPRATQKKYRSVFKANRPNLFKSA